MSLLDLPNEVLGAICEDRRLNQRDLYSITRTCRRLFHISVPYLYRLNYLSKNGPAITWAIKGNRMAVIQRALDSGLDVVRVHHLALAMRHGPDDLFTKLWANKAEHGGVPDPNSCTDRDSLHRDTLFNIARYYGRYDAIKTLLKAGKIHINDRNEALWNAAHDGSDELVKLLLERGANAMTLNYQSISPLSIAAGHNYSSRCSGCFDRTQLAMNNPGGCLETARLLLHHGVEIERRDITGRTALHHAAAAGDCQMVELLASYGADPTARIPSSGHTTLHTTNIHVRRLDMTELLLRLGADASAIDNDGQSTVWMPVAGNETAASAKILLESGAGMEADRDGNTPLHDAARNGSRKLAELLVEHGADINATSRWGATPFITAVETRDAIEVIKFLIERGADTTMAGESGLEALLKVVRVGPADTIRVVLENVANLEDVMGWKELLLDRAVVRGSQEIIDLIVQYGYEWYLAKNGGGRLHQGAITGDFALMQSVLDEGASIDAGRDKQGRTALVVAIDVGATASIDWLLRKGASANIRDTTRKKSTPLHHATNRDAIAAVGLLLKHGARVGRRNHYGQTALHMASRSGNAQIVKMLLESGANIWELDEYGMTPLQLASKYCPNNVLPLLTEKVGKSRRSGRRFRELTSR